MQYCSTHEEICAHLMKVIKIEHKYPPQIVYILETHGESPPENRLQVQLDITVLFKHGSTTEVDSGGTSWFKQRTEGSDNL